MFSFYPQQRFSSYTTGPAPAPALSSRERYLAALAEAKAAEEEYLREQALQQEEAALRRRLQEIQLHKQQTGLRHSPLHASPFGPGLNLGHDDYTSIDRQEIQREARQQAIAARQAQLEVQREQLIAQQLRETHQRASQQLRQQIVSASPLQRRHSGCYYGHLQCQKACGTQLTHRHACKRVQTPQEPQSVNVEVDLAQLLGFPSVHKPKVMTSPVRRASSTPTPQPPKATLAKQHSEVDAIQQMLDLFLGAEKPLPVPAPASQQSKTAPAPQAKPDNSLPREVEIDLSKGFEDFLSALGLAPRSQQPQASTSSKTPSSSSSSAPAAGPSAEPYKAAEKVTAVPQTRTPESTEHGLKKELEARLNNEYEAEVRDTIQAIFASLHENHSSAPFASKAAPASPSSSSDKGKTKIVVETPSEPTSKDIADAMDAVRSIETAFVALESDFTFPAQLDFDLSTASFDDAASVHSSDSEGSASSHLAFTSRNHPIRFYEQALGSLLTQLDAIESFGNEELRKARKEVVAKVEKALDELEWEVQGRWRSKLAKESKASEPSSPTTPVAAQEIPSTTTVGSEEQQEEAKQVNVVEDQAPEEQTPESVNVTTTPDESSLTPADIDAASEPVQSTTESNESEVLAQTVPEPVEEDVAPVVAESQDVEVAPASNPTVTDEEVPVEVALEVEDIVPESASAPVEADATPSLEESSTLDSTPALVGSAVDARSDPESSTSSLDTSSATIKPQPYEIEEESESEAEAEDVVDDEVESISEDDVDTFLLPSSKELEAQRKPRHDDESTSDWSEVEA